MKWFQKLPYAEITTMHSSENVTHTEHTLKMQHRYHQTNFPPFNNYFLLHVHSCTESLVLILIPWCCSSDDGFLVVGINVSYQLFQSNLLVTLCFLYIFIH